jgi:hypothetical protein
MSAAARALAILFAGLALAPPCVAQSVPPGFVFEPRVLPPFGGSASGFAFLPDERVLVIERQGNVRISAVGSTASTAILAVPGVDFSDGEEGLLGVAVDPEWPSRPYVYFCYTRTDSVTCVTMYTASGELSNAASTNLVLSSPFHLLTDIPNDEGNHNGGTLRFAPDGMLYLSMGDDGDNCPGPQRLDNLLGKILRLDVSGMPGAGTGPPPKADITPPDNPFPGPNENERLVWAWGLRNPFRFTVDPTTNDLWIGDVGWFSFEELDRSDWAAGGGENFGWPHLEGFAPTGVPCDSTQEWTDPIYSYAHEGDFSTIIAGPRVRVDDGDPDPFPASYDGSVFFLEFYAGWIRRLVEGPGGWELAPSAPGQPSAENWAEGLFHVSDAQQGPDGSLYLCHLFSPIRGVHRIRFVTATDAASAPAAPAVSAGLQVVPNPVRAGSLAIVRWDAAAGPMRSLTIVDVAGRAVDALRASGPGSASWDARLPGGVYFVRLETANGRSLRTKVAVTP